VKEFFWVCGNSGGFFHNLGNRLACAAEFGDAHSLSAATGTQNNFLGKAFLGNTFSGLTQLGLLAAGGPSGATATDAGIAVLSGTHPGTTAQAMLWVHDTAGGDSVQSSLITPGTGWQQVAVTFTADSTNAMCIHLYFSTGGGTIYYDDVQVQILSPVGDTSITTHKFAGDERDSETSFDRTWFPDV